MKNIFFLKMFKVYPSFFKEMIQFGRLFLWLKPPIRPLGKVYMVHSPHIGLWWLLPFGDRTIYILWVVYCSVSVFPKLLKPIWFGKKTCQFCSGRRSWCLRGKLSKHRKFLFEETGYDNFCSKQVPFQILFQKAATVPLEHLQLPIGIFFGLGEWSAWD